MWNLALDYVVHSNFLLFLSNAFWNEWKLNEIIFWFWIWIEWNYRYSLDNLYQQCYMISESECVHFYLSGRIDGCNENFNDIFYKSHVKRIASILWILLEVPKRRIYCIENIFAINFLLMVIQRFLIYFFPTLLEHLFVLKKFNIHFYACACVLFSVSFNWIGMNSDTFIEIHIPFHKM